MEIMTNTKLVYYFAVQDSLLTWSFRTLTFIFLSIIYLSMQNLILEGDFNVNYSLLSSLLEKTNSYSDLHLFPLNQLVPSPTHFSHTGVSSIIDLCSSQASATHWNTYQPYLFPLIHIPSSRHYHPSNIKIPFSSFPLQQNCGTLFHLILEYLHPFAP